MSQHDQIIDDDIGLPVRLDINAALAAIFSSSAGATEPGVIVPGQLWFDMSTGTGTIKFRNAANTAWKTINIGTIDSTTIYTRAEMEARFQPLAITYTMSQSDTLFNPLSYTKTEFDAKLNPIINLTFAPSAAPTKKAHLDPSPVTAGQDRAIRVPDKVGLAMGGMELIIDEEFTPGILFKHVLDLDAFESFWIEAELWPVSLNTGVFDMYFSSNNGASWINAVNTYWQYYLYTGGAAASAGGTDAPALRLSTGNPQWSGVAGVRNLVDLKIHGFNKAQWKRGRMSTCFQNTAVPSTNSYIFDVSVGCYSTALCNAIRIDAAGVPFQGHLTIHGMRG